MNIRSKFRRVGGSTMIAVPPALLEELGLGPGAEVSLEAKSGRLIVSPTSKATPSLEDLIDQCDRKAKPPQIDEAWVGGKRRGREII